VVDHRENRVAVENMFMVDWYVDRGTRSGSCGDDDRIGGEGLYDAVDCQHFNQAVGAKLGSAVEQCDAVACQLVCGIDNGLIYVGYMMSAF
jgi:hypothetical protein